MSDTSDDDRTELHDEESEYWEDFYKQSYTTIELAAISAEQLRNLLTTWGPAFMLILTLTGFGAAGIAYDAGLTVWGSLLTGVIYFLTLAIPALLIGASIRALSMVLDLAAVRTRLAVQDSNEEDL